jgi:hypothetical protein
MSFSWTSITAGVTNITAAQMNEVKTNVDHLTTQLGVTAYSWSTLPVSQYAKAMAANLTELQTAITYVDGLNTCATYNAAHNSGILTGDDNAIHAGKDVSIHTGKDAAIHTGKDSVVDNAQNTYYLNDHNTTVNNAQNTYYLNDHNTSVLIGQYSTVYNPYYNSNLSTYWTSAENGAYWGYNTSY